MHRHRRHEGTVAGPDGGFIYATLDGTAENPTFGVSIPENARNGTSIPDDSRNGNQPRFQAMGWAPNPGPKHGVGTAVSQTPAQAMGWTPNPVPEQRYNANGD